MDGGFNTVTPTPQERAYSFVEHLRYGLMPHDGILQLAILLTLVTNFAGKEIGDGEAAMCDMVELLGDYPPAALKKLPRIVTKSYSQTDLTRFNQTHRAEDQGRLGAVCQSLLEDMRVVSAVIGRQLGADAANAMLLRYVMQAGLRSVPAGMFLGASRLAGRAGQVASNTIVVVLPKTVIRGYSEAVQAALDARADDVLGRRPPASSEGLGKMKLGSVSPALVATIGRVSQPVFFIDYAEQVNGFWKDASPEVTSKGALDNLVASAVASVVCRMTASRGRLGSLLVERLDVSLIEAITDNPLALARQLLPEGSATDTPEFFREKVADLSSIIAAFVKRSISAHAVSGSVVDFEMVADILDLALTCLLPVMLRRHIRRIVRLLRLGGQIVPHPLGSGRLVMIAGDRLVIKAAA